jgi:integrase
LRDRSAIFNHAVEDGILTVNPAARLGKFLKHGDRREKCEILTFEEGRLFLETAKAHYPRHYPIFAAALYTGMRQGESVALKWDDIDFHGRFIEVRRATP